MTDPIDCMVAASGWEAGVFMPRDVDPKLVHRTIGRLLQKGMAFAVLATDDRIHFLTYADAEFERRLPHRGRDGIWRFE